MPTPALLWNRGLTPYDEARAFQGELACARASGHRLDTLLLLEHLPVYTVGRRTDASHRPAANSVPLITSDRGGSVTYHGPGQLIGYPIFRVAQFCAGPRMFVQKLEGALIAALADFGIGSWRADRRPGVWTDDACTQKIASIGLRVIHGVATHGFALNVDLDLSPFNRIVPCGLTDCRMTSMAARLGAPVPMAPVREAVGRHIGAAFDLRWTEDDRACRP